MTTRTRIVGVVAATVMATASAAPAVALGDLWRGARGIFGGGSDRDVAAGVLNAAEADAAVRALLEEGADLAIGRLGVLDGFWADPDVRIQLPRDLRNAQSTLERFGASAPLDEIQFAMNRAAETAIAEARPLAREAIAQMTIEDAVSIVRGGDDAATQYLRRATGPALQDRFEPIMADALSRTGAYASLEDAVGDLPPYLGLDARQARDALSDHATDRALDAFFGLVADRERAVRQDPVGEATGLVRRVFGD